MQITNEQAEIVKILRRLWKRCTDADDFSEWDRAIEWPGFGEWGPHLMLYLDGSMPEASAKRCNDWLNRLLFEQFMDYLDKCGIPVRIDDESQWSIWMTKEAVADILNCDYRKLEELYGDRVQSKGRQQWRFRVASFDQAVQIEYESWLEKKNSAPTRAN